MKKLAALGLALSLLSAPAFADGFTFDFGGPRPPAGVTLSTDYTWTSDNALTLHDQASSATVTFTIPDGTDPSAWVMNVTDRIANLQPGQQWTVFPNFVINGRSVSTEAIPWDEFRTTSYPVGQYLRPGKNVLQITATVAEAYEYQVEKIVIGPQ